MACVPVENISHLHFGRGRKIGMIIAVASGRGGTGKTTVATKPGPGLAWEMKIGLIVTLKNPMRICFKTRAEEL